MNNEKEKYPSLFNEKEGDTDLFEKELKNYITNLKGSFSYEFKNIYFRECRSMFYSNIFDSLEETKNIDFKDCDFFFSDITYKGNNIFKGSTVTFSDCRFKSSFNIEPDFNYPNMKLIYKNCIFLNTLKIVSIDSNITFNDCSFNNIELKNCNIKNNIFINEKYFKSKINKLEIDNCIFEYRFILNNHYIEIFTCTNCVFKNKFELKENNIMKFDIHNCNFEKISDMFSSKFIQFKISKSIFNDFSGFENCIFGTSSKLIEEVAEFEYVTFKDILTLRNTKFLSGLDIENINLQNDANFLKTNVELKNTPRETFRLIKHSFDKLGNIIEANNFYSLEMKKKEEELKNSSIEWIVFKIHDIASNHSQNWTLPLFWILIISYIYTYIFNFLDDKEKYMCIIDNISQNSIISSIYINDNLFLLFGLFCIMLLPKIVADIVLNKNSYLLIILFSSFLYIYFTKDFTFSLVSNNINPFSIITEKGHLSFYELLYRVLIAYLIYQFIISIRQNTRRK
jgi:uncharacterized protein YjbI with pentapeptide repeats